MTPKERAEMALLERELEAQIDKLRVTLTKLIAMRDTIAAVQQRSG